MALNIQTFTNMTGGLPFFKAVGHPYASNKIKSIMDELGKDCLIAVYDPHDHATTFSETVSYTHLTLPTILLV